MGTKTQILKKVRRTKRVMERDIVMDLARQIMNQPLNERFKLALRIIFKWQAK